MDNTHRGSSPIKQGPPADSPEQLLDAFKAAALSVTKLYKTSAAAQSKARSDGYQDCLDDLLAFLDRRNIGLNDGEGWLVRRWASERLEGRDGDPQSTEDEDEPERSEPMASPELPKADHAANLPPPQLASDSTPSSSQQPSSRQESVVVPSQDTFNFQSAHPYPSESYLNLAKLDLSDSSKATENKLDLSSGLSLPQISHGGARVRRDKRNTRARPGNNNGSSNLGRGAGTKRTINLAELFDVGSITSFGKDAFGRDGKRTRHT